MKYPEARIEELQAKQLIGKSLKMSFAENRTGELWASFLPRRNEITRAVSGELFSLQIYSPGHFRDFDPTRNFEKWALVEVTDFAAVPEGLQTFTLPGGSYAVFNYRGRSGDGRIFQYIFTEWLPASGYQLDDRPHFEVLGARYKNDDPDSEEQIWIPIRPV
ncbi:GyrI-like domain-containing protein [Flavilitoribacter nigricans DSM 23189 = NBRC 102662]|uniref:GyrI-like domain-containing protein n=2 Tax=Flavilitoribacter TaxID=2762562 RepID=A0A2D0N2B1_FLAN2|nr:GyrI-like domain-containing protein [Flavilitoribacter nigricans DSM 23189 = NBRC 102662]